MSFSNSSFKQTSLFPSAGSSNKQPKSPKSPKVAIENPLLKNPQFMMAPSLISEPALLQSNNRSPLRSLLSNSQQPKTRMKLAMTPGPPPKASLSLTGMAPMTQVSVVYSCRCLGTKECPHLIKDRNIEWLARHASWIKTLSNGSGARSSFFSDNVSTQRSDSYQCNSSSHQY